MSALTLSDLRDLADLARQIADVAARSGAYVFVAGGSVQVQHDDAPALVAGLPKAEELQGRNLPTFMAILDGVPVVGSCGPRRVSVEGRA